MPHVINIPDKAKPNLKPIQYTHMLSIFDGWQITAEKPISTNKVVYLGTCQQDGHMFAEYSQHRIYIYKGHLNSGTY